MSPLGNVRLNGIDTLTAAVGRDAPHLGLDCGAAAAPNVKRLGPKFLEEAARQQVALDIEGVLNRGVDCEETLGRSGRLKPLLFTLSSSNRLV